MLYQLLRNNTVTGPFTKETLLQQGLLPTDMLKAADEEEWKYPSEFEEFKNAAKPKFKITATKEILEIKDKPDEVEKPVMPAGSPFKRMPSALPRKPQANKKDFSPKSPVAREAQQHAKKATYQKPADYKQRAKKGSSHSSKGWLLPLLIIAAIGVLCWFGYEKFFAVNPYFDLPAATPSQDTVAETPPPPDTPRIVAPPVNPPVDSETLALQKDSLAFAAEEKKLDSLNIKRDTANTAKPEQHAAAVSAVKKPPKPIAKNTPPEIRQKSMDDYIALSLNKIPDKEVKNIKVNVKNIGNQPLNIAVINVSYFDGNGVFVKSETLEAENIGVGKTVSVKIPDSKNAAKVICKTSLISGDNIYLMSK